MFLSHAATSTLEKAFISRSICFVSCNAKTNNSDTTAAFNFVDEDMSGCLDSEEWRRFLDRFKTSVALVNMRSMFLHLDKVCTLHLVLRLTGRRTAITGLSPPFAVINIDWWVNWLLQMNRSPAVRAAVIIHEIDAYPRQTKMETLAEENEKWGESSNTGQRNRVTWKKKTTKTKTRREGEANERNGGELL